MSYDSIFKPGLFDGQTIIVTGGGSGIGRCTAHELAALGAHVVLVGRKAEKLEKTAGEIIEDGGSASWHSCDIRDEEAVKALVAQVIAERGPIHHLVNNAGGQYPAPLASINLDTKEAEGASYERSDVCAISAASVIVENVVAIEIAAALVDKFGGDSLQEMQARYKLFQEMAAER